MDSISTAIVNALQEGGVDAVSIQRYVEDVKCYPDNLEMISLYWVSKITNLTVNIRPHVDMCLFLRDTVSEVLWINYFRDKVVPFVVQHRLLG
ncbi:hypothetical protein TSMG0066 [Halocynthia phage JM-2012]|uniref:hypothetical protein n=1 Tax=Halocynthia phage JM-2012 TaxID=1173297 RepID=UPI00025C6916|nr:hypothetical protein TSMG0066 [Halocynthia phage JM-2012]AFI55349.1 hypothetical protein TSMG0066 [Halocynthia phage JM-2012]